MENTSHHRTCRECEKTIDMTCDVAVITPTGILCQGCRHVVHPGLKTYDLEVLGIFSSVETPSDLFRLLDFYEESGE